MKFQHLSTYFFLLLLLPSVGLWGTPSNGKGISYYGGVLPFIYSSDYANTTMLYDETRNILTLDGHKMTENANGTYNYSQVDTYHSALNVWNLPLVQTVIIDDASPLWWRTDASDKVPEFFIVIKDEQGNELYKSACTMNSGLPVTFHILPETNIIACDDIYLEVWEYNPSGSTCCPYAIQLTASQSKTYTWLSEHITGKVLICPNPAIDVHWGMSTTYDYFYQTFSRRGVDDNNKRLVGFVNPPASLPSLKNAKFPNNSCAVSGTGYYFFGMGDHKQFGPLVCLDVVAHEYAHGITNSNTGHSLPTSGEGGAINESFSDIFACAVERFAYGETDWEMTTQAILDGSCMRSLKDPKRTEKNLHPSPNTYKGDLWDFQKQDVHINCGGQNYWFYLLCNGGMGTVDDHGIAPWRVEGIGFDAAIRIAYRTYIYYVNAMTTYTSLRENTLQAARDLYGADSNAERAVANAWHAVGIGGKHHIDSFTIQPGLYVVVANRQTERDNQWYYLSAHTKQIHGGTRLEAVPTGVRNIRDVNTYSVSQDCVWQLDHTSTGWTMRCGAHYLSYEAPDNAFMSDEAVRFAMARNEYVGNIAPASNMKALLALSTQSSEDYFFFTMPSAIGGYTNGMIQLTFLPYNGALETVRDGLPEVTETTRQTRKVMHDGAVYILVPDGKQNRCYDLQGQLHL